MANFDRERAAAVEFFKSWDMVKHDEAIDALAEMLRAARNSERERSATVATNYAAGFDAAQDAEGRAWCPKCGEYARNVADDIATSIREDK